MGTCRILLITRNKISGSLPAVKAKHSTEVSILKAVETYPFFLTKHTCWFSNSCIVCHTSSFAFLYHISNTNQWIVSQTNSLSVPGWVWTTLYFSYLLLLENACLCCQRSSRFLRYSENSWQFGQGKSLTAWEAYDHICCFLKTPIKG